MSRTPDFTKINFNLKTNKISENEWRENAAKTVEMDFDKLSWLTNEQIRVKPLYTAADTEKLEHLDYVAGIPPFFRGPYATMYVMRPWTVRQYAGFSTAEESNAFYRRNLAAGQKVCR